MRSLAAVVLVTLAAAASPALAEQPRRKVMVPAKLPPDRILPAVVNTKTIFINRCKGDCVVASGYSDSRTNKSSIGRGTLSEYKHGDASWDAVKACMVDVFGRFNVTITDVDPGPYVDHFEVMVAGAPQQIGLPSYVLGIAEYACHGVGACDKYIPNALVFAFANAYANDPDEICATAAQEIAHTWSLDHVSDPSDPMTYYQFSGRRQFKDGVYCGSDCQGGQSPFGLTCTGGNHVCMSTGQATQDDVQMLLDLFGPKDAVNPNLNVLSPTTGAGVSPGFTVEAECTVSGGATIQEVQFSLDGVPKQTLTAPPYVYTAPAMLADGVHRIGVLCATTQQAIATKRVDVLVGAPCSSDSQCAEGYLCHGACVAGPGTQGGLGAPCGSDLECLAGRCAFDGEQSLCTIPCDLSNKACPDGFGCLEAGAEDGVCWAGYDDSGGCCDTGRGPGDPRGSLLLGLGVAALWITSRRRTKRG